jgi:predicted Zn-dependent protease
MGQVVLFDPEAVKGCEVKIVEPSMLESTTAAGWNAVASIHDDAGGMRFLLARPRGGAELKRLRVAVEESFRAGSDAAVRAVKGKNRDFDPVAAAETYAKSYALG